METTKAVVFTHIPITWEEAEEYGKADAVLARINRHIPYFKAYLKCKYIGLVYVYVDLGTAILLKHLRALSSGEAEVHFGLRELHVEQRARNCLKLAVDQALQDLSYEDDAFDITSVPRFQFIGLPHLSSLFYSLFRIDPVLIAEIANPEGEFTYDAPKFVEAMLRLARGTDPVLGRHPILRFDADVEVNDAGVVRLLQAVTRGWAAGRAFDFFSGGYGQEDREEDPTNDYAVRVHWVSHQDPSTGAWQLDERWRFFTRDLGEIGATQVPSDWPLSSQAREMVAEKRHGRSANRKSAQVISGAGLYMSLRAISVLPPFMNTTSMTVWIDDHLKRRLHEQVGHLESTALEQVSQARFRQFRHPDGIQTKDIARAESDYLLRLLRGCIFHVLIVTPYNTPGLLAQEVGNYLNTARWTTSPETIRRNLLAEAHAAASDVLELWRRADYGTELLSRWAIAQTPTAVDEICLAVVDDVLRYLRLVELWQKYVTAITKLVPVKAYWLFMSAGNRPPLT